MTKMITELRRKGRLRSPKSKEGCRATRRQIDMLCAIMFNLHKMDLYWGGPHCNHTKLYCSIKRLILLNRLSNG
jgi:hypothetical protein